MESVDLGQHDEISLRGEIFRYLLSCMSDWWIEYLVLVVLQASECVDLRKWYEELNFDHYDLNTRLEGMTLNVVRLPTTKNSLANSEI